jgi:uncharacterized OB-fold protein
MLNRPIPIPDVESAPFWEGCKRGKLLIQRCGDHYQFPPTSYCTRDQSLQPEWVESAGRGTVFSWIVVHVPIPREIYGDQVPYVSALITLDEGPRICANLVDVEPSRIKAGMPVAVFFQPIGDGEAVLPFFKPVSE